MIIYPPSDENRNKRLCQSSISKAVRAQRNNETGDESDDDRPRKIRNTTPFYSKSLPHSGLNIIFKRLKTKDDRDSFGLTCRQWLHIQNKNRQYLWYRNRNGHIIRNTIGNPNERFSVVLSKLLSRFQNLKYLSLMGLPMITDFVILQPQFTASKLQNLCLDGCFYSDAQLSLMFSWLPRLTYVSLVDSLITDRGLEALAKCCSSLKTVDLSYCGSITDSGIAFLLQSLRELRTLCIYSCCKITGIGFLGCPETLTDVDARGCELIPEGIEAIVSGGGLERLGLSAPYELPKVGQGLRRTY